MLEKSKEIAQGLNIIKKLVSAENSYIAVESNKMGAVFTLEKIVNKIPYLPKKVLLKNFQ